MRTRRKISPNAIHTLIGEGTTIEGKLITKTSIRIEGTINGDIECAGDVTVGPKGIARSNLIARNVITAGVIQGSVTAKELLSITKTGKVYGNIHVPVLTVVEGGTFQGMSRMDMKTSHDHHPDHNDENKPQTVKSDKIAVVK